VSDGLALLARVSGIYEPISLSALGGAALTDRIDTKFALTADTGEALLRSSAENYRVLEIDGRRIFRYVTQYFDTQDLTLFRAHHAGRLPRRKVRVRSYVDTGTLVAEVKLRDNHGRTVKFRQFLGEGDDPLAFLESLPAAVRGELVAPELRPSLVTSYTRMTLVRNDSAERVTFDAGLAFSRGGDTVTFPTLVLGEAKQSGREFSPFISAARDLRVRPMSVSKYCLGVVQLHQSAKSNRFKPTLSRLHSFIRSHDASSITG
jgi:hypothetical protein